ncbi:hypothetical protein GIW70_23865 [Pseudomonas syringae]|nr:hypothetical protein [Pseudomonas syringae]MCF5071219.1 hypothetical protein [Pseudomonas syringae]
MFKPTPNPPLTDPASPYESPDSKKFHDCAERALDYYLKPSDLDEPDQKPAPPPTTIYAIAPNIVNEELLANACESLTSASLMLSDFAGLLSTPQRHRLIGIQQVVMLGELAVNRMLDNLKPAT